MAPWPRSRFPMTVLAPLAGLARLGARLKRHWVGEQVWSGPGGCGGALSERLPDVSYDMGEGRHAVLLIHGLTGTPVEMRYVAKGLAAAGYHVHAVQLAGHCGTEGDLLRTNWQDWTASVEAAFDRLSQSHDKVAVGGLSMGAVLALHLATRRPTAAGLLLYSPVIWHDGWSLPRMRWLLPLVFMTPLCDHYRLVESFPYGLKDERLRNVVLARMMSGDSTQAGSMGMAGASLREMLKLVRLVKRRLPAITVPALILHSREDDVASLRNADFLAARLGGPVDKVVLDDCYHLIVLDRQRARVVQESVRFLDGALSSTRAVSVAFHRLSTATATV